MQGCPAQTQLVQLPQPFLFPGPGYDGGVVKRQFPIGENGRRLSQKRFQFLLKPFGGHVILTDDHDGAYQILPQSCNEMTAVNLSDSGNGGGFLPGDGLKRGGIFGDGIQNMQKLFHGISSQWRFFSTRQRGKGKIPPLSVAI